MKTQYKITTTSSDCIYKLYNNKVYTVACITPEEHFPISGIIKYGKIGIWEKSIESDKWNKCPDLTFKLLLEKPNQFKAVFYPTFIKELLEAREK